MNENKYAVIVLDGAFTNECYGPFTKEQADDYLLSLGYGIVVPLVQPAGYDFL